MNRTRLVDTIASSFDVISIACDLIGRDDKKGGYLYVTDQSGHLVTLTMIGSVPEEKRPKYIQLAMEKAVRLEVRHNDVSSWQSRNPQQDRWGGAIRSVRYIFSFSGLPEDWDEACMLVLAHDVGELNSAEFKQIAEISNNQFATILKSRMDEIN